MRRSAAAAIVALLIFCTTGYYESIPLPQRQDEDEVLSFEIGYYSQDDGSDDAGGNESIDEDETVFEAIIMLDKPLSERDRLNVRFLGDLISSASQTRLHNPQFRALQSNPSGNEHAELRVGWQRQLPKFTMGYNTSFGIETSSYFSFGYGADFATSFFEDNTTVSLSLQGFTDYFQIKLFNGEEPGYDVRQTITAELGLTQVLTPKTVANLTVNHTHQLGFLSTTFNSVFVDGVEFTETAPDSRRRNSVTIRGKQALSDINAIELGYRFYNDQWKINSHTIDARYFQYVWQRRFLLEPNYRLYTQTAAFFYQPVFTELPELRTSDPDIGDFTGHIFGLKVTWLKPPFLPKWSRDLSLSYSYYLRNDDLAIYWITTGYTLNF